MNDRKILSDAHNNLDDPLDLTAAVASQRALQVLRNWCATDPVALLRALPACDLLTDRRQPSAVKDPFVDQTNEARDGETSQKRKRGKKVSAAASTDSETHEDEDDVPIQRSAARIKRCSDIWDILGGKSLERLAPPKKSGMRPSARHKPDGKRERKVVAETWPFFRFLLDAWEQDAKLNTCP